MRKLPAIISLLLFIQLLLPVMGVYASSLQAPTNVKVYERYPGSVVIEWNAVPYSSAYKVYRINGDTKTLDSQVKSNAAYVNLPEGTYTFAVSAIVSGQESPISSPVSITIMYPDMQAPTNLQASVQSFYDLTLSWDSSAYVHYYKIYQIINGTRKLVTTTDRTSFKFNTLPEGHYVYEISSYNSIFGESELVARVEADIIYPEVQAPSNLAYKITNGSDVTLSWYQATYANKYNIYKVEGDQRKLVTSTTNLSATLTKVTEGKQRYEVTAYSYTFGESKNAAVVEFDVLHPDMQAPGNLSLAISNGNDGMLTWSEVDYTNYYKVYQVIDGSRVLLRETAFPQLSFTNMEEGNYIYEVTSYSDRFGESPAAHLEQQVVHPKMQKPEGFKASILYVNSVYLQWNKAEYATSYKLYQVINGERKFISDITNTYTVVENLPEGNYVYEITSYSDRFGESIEGSSVEVSIVYPEIQAPENLQAVVNQDVNSIALWWDEVEYASSYNVYQVVDGERILLETTINTRTLFKEKPVGKYVYEVTANSKYGVSPASNQATAYVEPELEAPTTPDAAIKGNDAVLSWDPVKDANAYNVYEEVNGERVLVGSTSDPELSLPGLESGEHTYVIVPVSESGKESSSSSTIVVEVGEKDITAPVTESNVVDKWNREAVSVELTATDDVSGVANTYYSLNGTDFVEGTSFIVSDVGVSTISFYSVDHAGNVEEVKTVDVKIDEAPPVTTSNVTDQWLNQSYLLKLTATDDLSGVKETYYSINGEEYVKGTTIFVSDSGVNTVSFLSVDNAGNVEEVKTVEVKIDNEAPETVSNVVDGWNQGEVSVELTATDDLSGVANTFYSINGSEFVEGTTFTVTEEGVNEVSFYSVDNAGNVEETKTVEVKIDTEAPETVSNVTDKWNQGEAAVELTATDALSGVAKTFYSVNGSEFVEGTTFTITDEGLNEVSFYSVDNAGNVEEAKTVEVKIDTMAPETVSNVANQWNKGEVAVELTATDALSGVAKTFYSINGTEFVEGTMFTVTEEGINEVSFYSVDNAGNVEEVKTVEVEIDTKAPDTVSNVTDEWNKGEVAVELTATDALSGVAKTFYSINGSEFLEGTAFTVTEEGVNKVTFYSVDNAGNVEKVKTVEVKIDKTAPTVSFDIAAEQELGSTFTLDYLAADNLSGIAVEDVTVNGKSYQKGDQVTLSEPGAYKLVVTVTDAAGWTTQVEKEFLVYIPATLEVLPKVIKGNKGVFTVKAILPESFESLSFDVSSFTLNGVAADPKNNGLQKQAEKGHFKFEREDFDWKKGEVTLVLRGYLENGTLIIAKKTVEVK
ncbi:OmpL47-type beta-barrel domain-containing protein [Neobacillus niacini]|uniref:OmpL47-type beta-barrel domain-containing protein n=1 Tax=Neobacillus niacini TaxID=86668 RepID=UPI003B0183E6